MFPSNNIFNHPRRIKILILLFLFGFFSSIICIVSPVLATGEVDAVPSSAVTIKVPNLEQVAATLKTEVKLLTIKQIVDEYRKNDLLISSSDLVRELQLILDKKNEGVKISGENVTVGNLNTIGISNSTIYDTAYSLITEAKALPPLSEALEAMINSKFNNKSKRDDYTVRDMVNYYKSIGYSIDEAKYIASLNKLTNNKPKVDKDTTIGELFAANVQLDAINGALSASYSADEDMSTSGEWINEDSGCERGLSGLFCVDLNGGDGVKQVTRDIASNVNVLLSVLAAIMIIFGSYRIITANGDPKRVTQGREIIFSALIGIAIFVGYNLIVSFINPAINPIARL